MARTNSSTFGWKQGLKARYLFPYEVEPLFQFEESNYFSLISQRRLGNLAFTTHKRKPLRPSPRGPPSIEIEPHLLLFLSLFSLGVAASFHHAIWKLESKTPPKPR